MPIEMRMKERGRAAVSAIVPSAEGFVRDCRRTAKGLAVNTALHRAIGELVRILAAAGPGTTIAVRQEADRVLIVSSSGRVIEVRETADG